MIRQSYVEKCLCRMRRWMALRGLAPNSVSTYTQCARQFLVHVDRPLAAVRRTHIEGYLHTLVDKARSPGTRNVQLGAIRCLLLSTVRRDPSATIPRAKVPRVVPQILSGTEVLRLLAATISHPSTAPSSCSPTVRGCASEKSRHSSLAMRTWKRRPSIST